MEKIKKEKGIYHTKAKVNKQHTKFVPSDRLALNNLTSFFEKNNEQTV